MNPLPNDFTRCYGKSCHQKETCRRFLTLRVDPPITLSYVATAIDEDGDCEARIPATAACLNCQE